MTDKALVVRCYEESDRDDVIALWAACDLLRPWNDPHKDIDRKMSFQPDLFFVGTLNHDLIATAMLGYDGHRGSLYYFCVAPESHKLGYGRELMRFAEQTLIEMGCPKLNLFVRESNLGAKHFYTNQEYTTDPAISLSKRLIADC